MVCDGKNYQNSTNNELKKLKIDKKRRWGGGGNRIDKHESINSVRKTNRISQTR